MASLHLALVAASCVLLLTASAAPPPQSLHVVGGERGWTVPPSGTETSSFFDQWAERRRFVVGDVLGFKYSNNDSVLLVPRDGYEQCATAAAVNRFDDGHTNFTLDRPGHCQAGQRMAVRVAAAPASAAAAPAAAKANPGGTTPPAAAGSTGQTVVVLKLTTSAIVWVATVSLFLFILICVLFYCNHQQVKMSRDFIRCRGEIRQ